jgi:hypothetical protein
MIPRWAIALPLVLVAGCGGGSDSSQDATIAPRPSPTTAAVVVEGADSSEDAVSEWYRGLGTSDAPRMWSMIDPMVRTELRRPAWDACVAVRFPARSDVSIVYDEAEVYTEGGSVFSTGSVTIDGDFEIVTLPVTFEVVEREGGWFIVGEEASENDESCIAQSSR